MLGEGNGEKRWGVLFARMRQKCMLCGKRKKCDVVYYPLMNGFEYQVICRRCEETQMYKYTSVPIN